MTRFFLLILTVLLLPVAAMASDKLGNQLHEDYAKVLSAFVNEKGLVNYSGLKSSPEELDSYLEQLSAITTAEYEAATSEEKLAFWMNAYNAFTLKVIIDNYPIQPDLLKSALWPKNSIKHIDNAWDQKVFKVEDQHFSLNDIEHKIIRKEFDEPRIHVALVCAAISCPLLRTEPFYADQLDAQLEDQSRKFVNNPNNFKVEKKTVQLSSIFKWYGKDFVSKHRTAGGKFDEWDIRSDYRSVLAYAEPLLDEATRKLLNSGRKSVSIIKYDWELNEQ